MRARLYNKMTIGQTQMCPCDTAPMDTAHVPQDCPLQDIPTLAAWPEETPPEGEAVRRPCSPEEDGVVHASH